MITGNGIMLQLVINVAALKWQDRAACREIGEWPFFADSPAAAALARTVCARCPVTEQCLEYALEHEAREDEVARHGIWAGTTPGERRVIARSRQQGEAA